jgi:DNA-binding NtrC family response regulator
MIQKIERSPLCAKILIIDDDSRVLTAINDRLREMGCQCCLYNNACEAMARFASGDIDLVITDLTMPGVDGLSIIGLMRNTSDVPIIVVTGHGADYATLICQYENVTVLQKPFQSRTLKKCVHSSLLKSIAPERFPRVA